MVTSLALVFATVLWLVGFLTTLNGDLVGNAGIVISSLFVYVAFRSWEALYEAFIELYKNPWFRLILGFAMLVFAALGITVLLITGYGQLFISVWIFAIASFLWAMGILIQLAVSGLKLWWDK